MPGTVVPPYIAEAWDYLGINGLDDSTALLGGVGRQRNVKRNVT